MAVGQTRRSRGLAAPALVVLGGIAVLVGLGLWQLQRLTWKNDLIARVEARAVSAPISLEAALEAWKRNPADVEFQRVRLNGHFVNSAEFYVYATLQGSFGWSVITPFVTGAHLVPVIRGVVPDTLKNPETRERGQIDGETEVFGRIRFSEAPSMFTPAPDPAKRTWFSRDLGLMMPLLKAASPAAEVTPFYVELDGSPPPGGWPRPVAGSVTIRNDHLGYALTWFGLAAALVVVFVVFARSRRT